MHCVIIGNGVAGITAARFIRKLSDEARITVISSESKYFFSRTALMYVYMGQLRFKDIKPYEDWFWEKNRIGLVNDHVARIDFQNKTLDLRSGDHIGYDKLLIACGSTPNKFGWRGQDLKGVQGLYSLQDLETMDTASPGLQRAVIVGGGLIGIEMAEMFHSRKIPVTFLVREKSFWDIVLPTDESALVNAEIWRHGIDLRLDTELEEIEDDGHGQVATVITKDGERIPCGFVGLTAGVRPNVDWLNESGLTIEKGIVVDKNLNTNIEDVFAAGDCAQIANPLPHRQSIEAVWYVARIMGETAAYNMLDMPVNYDPGIWFNSAKFFTIEYQVYGVVPPKLQNGQQFLYWEHPDGNQSIRIVFEEKNNNPVIGFQSMGTRLRQEVCERWIRSRSSIETVLGEFELAEFDREFSDRSGERLRRKYFEETGKKVDGKQKRSWNAVQRFLAG